MTKPDALSVFIGRFTANKVIDESMLIHQGREWFLVPKHVRSVLQHARKRSVHCGILLAAEWGGPEGIKPGIHLLDLLAKQPDAKTVMVNDKAEWMTVCGRPPLLDNVIANDNHAQKDDLVLVLNKHKECIGYGDVHDGWTAKNGIIRLHFDIGDFLRRERGVKQKPLKEREFRKEERSAPRNHQRRER
jgi:ribosome biogenesis protein Nip4